MLSWWRHQTETFSALLVLCAGKFTGYQWIPSHTPLTRSFDVFFDLRLNNRSSKQSWCRWFETPSCSLWRHCNAATGPWPSEYIADNIVNIHLVDISKMLSYFITLIRDIHQKSERWFKMEPGTYTLGITISFPEVTVESRQLGTSGPSIMPRCSHKTNHMPSTNDISFVRSWRITFFRIYKVSVKLHWLRKITLVLVIRAWVQMSLTGHLLLPCVIIVKIALKCHVVWVHIEAPRNA